MNVKTKLILAFTLTFSCYLSVYADVLSNSEYVVKEKDCLYSIANAHNIKLDVLLKLNNLKKNDTIYPGDKLIISESNQASLMTPKIKNPKSINTLKKKTDIEIVTSALFLLFIVIIVFFSIRKRNDSVRNNKMKTLEAELARDELKLETIKKIIAS